MLEKWVFFLDIIGRGEAFSEHRFQVSGFRPVLAFLLLTPDTLYETSLCKYEIPPGRNSEQIERRTSNVQHRTSNIDGAALYRF